jgi:enoyl-CoA hydratase
LGFVNRLAEPGAVQAEALTLAETIAANAPVSVRSALAATNDFVKRDESLGWALAEQARTAIANTDDAAEGIAAFLERRPPQWTGR